MTQKQNKSGTIFIIIIALAGLILGGLAISTPKSSNQTGSTSGKVSEDSSIIENNKMFTMGNENAKVKIIVFSDFLCPYCAQLHEQLNETIAKEPNKIGVNVRTFIIHEEAAIMSKAAYAAGLQGKYKEASDLLFTKYTDGTEDKMIEMAGELGLDKDKFKTDLNSDAAAKYVETDNTDATKLGLQGTPSVFINNKYVDDLNELNALIEEAAK